jgi:hypothetical protein
MKTDKPMVDPKTWDDFRSTGLFLFINSILHAFGWAIVVEIDEDGRATKSFPARVRFRGFDEASQTEAHEKIAKYLASEAPQFPKEIDV